MIALVRDPINENPPKNNQPIILLLIVRKATGPRAVDNIKTYLYTLYMKAETLLPIFKNLSDSNRFNIYLYLVGGGEKSVGDICAHMGLSQPLTSHHLRHLRLVGLVVCRRKGNSILYSACGEKLNWFCSVIHNELRGKSGCENTV